nr:hypothetical protein [Streptomyces sp. NEAU-YJ-81]
MIRHGGPRSERRALAQKQLQQPGGW